MTVLLHSRVKPKVAARFQTAARRRSLSPYAFLQQIVTDAALRTEAVSSSASLELSRAGFTVPELPGKTKREQIRAAIARRHVSR
jgi:hypothetical protein